MLTKVYYIVYFAIMQEKTCHIGKIHGPDEGDLFKDTAARFFRGIIRIKTGSRGVLRQRAVSGEIQVIGVVAHTDDHGGTIGVDIIGKRLFLIVAQIKASGLVKPGIEHLSLIHI